MSKSDKKAVIEINGKQHIVQEGQVLAVDLQGEGVKALELAPLMLIDGEKVSVGDPTVKGVKVKAEVVEPMVKGEKLRVIRYKSKKRVHKEIGHRQKYTEVKILSIA
ncbi:50S ribosomal protein L21 [Candidatus Saccharibacteria bacterium]|nr:50S ribosomal protein L21 [Candidatus Saccharibacteria bacterium]